MQTTTKPAEGISDAPGGYGPCCAGLAGVSNRRVVPHTPEEYQRLVAFLDALIDEVDEDETHPLAFLMEVIGVLIERYEEEHVPALTEE